jgi:hypothetical protein
MNHISIKSSLFQENWEEFYNGDVNNIYHIHDNWHINSSHVISTEENNIKYEKTNGELRCSLCISITKVLQNKSKLNPRSHFFVKEWSSLWV